MTQREAGIMVLISGFVGILGMVIAIGSTWIDEHWPQWRLYDALEFLGISLFGCGLIGLVVFMEQAR